MYDRVHVHDVDRSIIEMIVMSRSVTQIPWSQIKPTQNATKGNGWIVPQKVSNGWARKCLKIIGAILIFKIELKVRS